MDLKLDASGDLDIIDGELSLTSGADAIGQDLRCRLLLFLGEWFLDQRLGVDWFGVALVKAPNLARINQMIRAAVMQTTGIKSIRELKFDYSAANRSLAIELDAELVDLTTHTFVFSELLLTNFQRAEPWPTA